MARQRRRFSQEFKQEAVQMARGADLSISQATKDLGIHTNVLSRWCREQKEDGAKAFRGQGVPREEELARLKRELARVKREREFLKTRRSSLPGTRREVWHDGTGLSGLSDPHDVSAAPGFLQWLRCQPVPAPESSGAGECPADPRDSTYPFRK